MGTSGPSSGPIFSTSHSQGIESHGNPNRIAECTRRESGGRQLGTCLQRDRSPIHHTQSVSVAVLLATLNRATCVSKPGYGYHPVRRRSKNGHGDVTFPFGGIHED
jgi:hypothetical protein